MKSPRRGGARMHGIPSVLALIVAASAGVLFSCTKEPGSGEEAVRDGAERAIDGASPEVTEQLTGTVVLEDGTGAAFAKVLARRVDVHDSTAGRTAVSLSDKRGRFRFDHLVAGRYRVEVVDVAGAPLKASAFVDAPSDGLVLVAVEQKYGVFGRILPDRELLSGVEIWLTPSGGSTLGARLHARSNEAGEFAFPVVPDGTWELFAMRSGPHGGGSQVATAKVIVRDAVADPIQLKFPESFHLTGVVLDESGSPVPNAEIRAERDLEALVELIRRGQRSSPPRPVPRARTMGSRDGTFTLRPVEEGIYRLTVYQGDRQLLVLDEATVEVHGDMDLVLRITAAREP